MNTDDTERNRGIGKSGNKSSPQITQMIADQEKRQLMNTDNTDREESRENRVFTGNDAEKRRRRRSGDASSIISSCI
jgi:hypothetical protein